MEDRRRKNCCISGIPSTVDQELKPLEKKISDKILRNCFSAFCVDREAVPRPVYTGGGLSYFSLPGVGGGRVEKSAKGRTTRELDFQLQTALSSSTI